MVDGLPRGFSMARVGFMQGRLSPLVDGKIQAFPWETWQSEFEIGSRARFDFMEWTIDQRKLHDNPLMSESGRREIVTLQRATGLNVRSVTGDCFMQSPFWKSTDLARRSLLEDFEDVVEASAALGCGLVVVPLVDNGCIASAEELESLLDGLLPLTEQFRALEIKVAFESDYAPDPLRSFIDHFAGDVFGINYDIGNSAALGFAPAEELSRYGDRVFNVHVKDRILGGTTVPLGEGAADFPAVFRSLKKCGYAGDYVLQTARATDGDHVGALSRYHNMLKSWLA